MSEIYMGTSHSEIDTMLTCERRHYYSYFLNLEPASKSKALETGTNVHDLLDRHFTKIQELQQQHGLDYITEEVITEVTGQTVAEALNQMYSAEVITMYNNAILYNPFNFWEVLAVEDKRKLTLPNGMHMTFIVDLILRDNNGYIWIIDHKTAYDFYPDYLVKLFPQLPKYVGALRSMGLPAHKAGYSFMRKRTVKNATQHDLYKFQEVEIPDKRIQQAIHEQYRGAQRVMSRRKLYDKDPAQLEDYTLRSASDMNCKMCPFKTLCAADMLGEDTEIIIALDYAQKAPRS